MQALLAHPWMLLWLLLRFLHRFLRKQSALLRLTPGRSLMSPFASKQRTSFFHPFYRLWASNLAIFQGSLSILWILVVRLLCHEREVLPECVLWWIAGSSLFHSSSRMSREAWKFGKSGISSCIGRLSWGEGECSVSGEFWGFMSKSEVAVGLWCIERTSFSLLLSRELE